MVENIQKAQGQGVSYSKKFCGKHGFPNLANSRLPNLFPKYVIEYQNVKIMNSKFKNEKNKKNKHINKDLKKTRKKASK